MEVGKVDPAAELTCEKCGRRRFDTYADAQRWIAWLYYGQAHEPESKPYECRTRFVREHDFAPSRLICLHHKQTPCGG